MAVMGEVGDTQAKSIHMVGFHVPFILFMARVFGGQKQGLLRVTSTAADPPVTPELAELIVYDTYGADVTTPLGDGEITMDIVMSPDMQQPLLFGDKVHQPYVHNAWHFQEP